MGDDLLLRPTSPLGYDRPMSPAAASSDVYRRTVPGISDMVRGTTRSMSPQPYQQQQQYTQYAQPRAARAAPYAYDVNVGAYDEPLHQPVVTARNQPHSVAVSLDRRLGGGAPGSGAQPYTQASAQQSAHLSQPSALSQSQPYGTHVPPNGASTSTAAVGASPSSTTAARTLEAIGAMERRVAALNDSLSALSEQMYVSQQQTVQRQDRLLQEACKNAKEQSTMLNILLAGVVLTFLVALLTAIYTTLVPMWRGTGAAGAAGGKGGSNADERRNDSAASTTAATNVALPTAAATKRSKRGGASSTFVIRADGSAAAANAANADGSVARNVLAAESMSEGIDSGEYARALRRQRTMQSYQ